MREDFQWAARLACHRRWGRGRGGRGETDGQQTIDFLLRNGPRCSPNGTRCTALCRSSASFLWATSALSNTRLRVGSRGVYQDGVCRANSHAIPARRTMRRVPKATQPRTVRGKKRRFGRGWAGGEGWASSGGGDDKQDSSISQGWKRVRRVSDAKDNAQHNRCNRCTGSYPPKIVVKSSPNARIGVTIGVENLGRHDRRFTVFIFIGYRGHFGSQIRSGAGCASAHECFRTDSVGAVAGAFAGAGTL